MPGTISQTNSAPIDNTVGTAAPKTPVIDAQTVQAFNNAVRQHTAKPDAPPARTPRQRLAYLHDDIAYHATFMCGSHF